MSTLDAFPRRPIAIRASRRTTLAAAGSAFGALLALAGALWFVVLFGPGLLHDARVWREGQSAPVTDVTGSCRVQLSWLPFSWCTLDVSYRAPDGSITTRPLSALTFVDFDRSVPPSVKVDPADDQAVALSWFADELPLRWLALSTAAGGLALLAGVIAGGTWTWLREIRLYRVLARDPNPVEARVIETRLVSSPGWAREIRFSYPAVDGSERTVKQRLRVLKGEHGVAPSYWTYEEPVRLSEGGDILLALASARGARLVKSSFEPFVLTDAEKQRIRMIAG